MAYDKSSIFVVPSSIDHPPHSLGSPVELRLREGSRTLSEKKELSPMVTTESFSFLCFHSFAKMSYESFVLGSNHLGIALSFYD